MNARTQFSIAFRVMAASRIASGRCGDLQDFLLPVLSRPIRRYPPCSEPSGAGLRELVQLGFCRTVIQARKEIRHFVECHPQAAILSGHRRRLSRARFLLFVNDSYPRATTVGTTKSGREKPSVKRDDPLTSNASRVPIPIPK